MQIINSNYAVNMQTRKQKEEKSNMTFGIKPIITESLGDELVRRNIDACELKDFCSKMKEDILPLGNLRLTYRDNGDTWDNQVIMDIEHSKLPKTIRSAVPVADNITDGGTALFNSIIKNFFRIIKYDEDLLYKIDREDRELINIEKLKKVIKENQ